MTDTSKEAVAGVVERLAPLKAAAEAAMADENNEGEYLRHASPHLMFDAMDLITALEARAEKAEAERDEFDNQLSSMTFDRDVYRANATQINARVEAAEARVDALAYDLNAALRTAEAAEALNATLQAKLEKAAEALEPFSKAETDITSQLMLGNLAYSIVWPDDMPIGLLWDADDTDKALVSVTWGDFHRAASTLSTLRETTDDQT